MMVRVQVNSGISRIDSHEARGNCKLVGVEEALECKVQNGTDSSRSSRRIFEALNRPNKA